MNPILEITKDQYSNITINGDNVGDMLAFGAKMLVIGLLTVFVVLALIWGALILFKIFLHDLPAKRAAAAKANEANAAEEASEAVADEDSTEIIAVLAAAIAAAEEGNAGKKFRVVSFRRN